MTRYIVRRLAVNVFLLFCITFAVYALSVMAPGSPEEQYITDMTTAEDIERIRSYLGLDKPAPVQYFRWLTRMLRGDMGNSFRVNGPVASLVREAAGPTLLLSGLALAVALAAALPLGALSAARPRSLAARVCSGVSYAGVAVPVFFVGLALVYVFCVRLGWLPTGGMRDARGGGLAVHLVLPVTVVAFRMAGIFLKQTRAAMTEVFHEEYIKMARAKGLPERAVILCAARNASIPIVTAVGLSIPNLVSGAVITETLFSIPGLGKLMMQSILFRDYPVIMAVAVFISVAVLSLNLFLDLLYGFLDPRIRTGRAA